MVTADTELCNETLITESYISFVKYVASDGPFNVVGVTGMTCAAVTLLLQEVQILISY